MLLLSDLIHAASDSVEPFSLPAPLNITGLTMDSRQVKPGFLFVALKGQKTDGTHFITQAEASGAVAVLCDADTPAYSRLPILRSHAPMRAFALMAAKFYGLQPVHVVAVTGTDGKTSTADFYRQFWHAMGLSSASIGTLGFLGGNGETLVHGTYTTPYPVQLHEALKDMAMHGVTHVAMEASSHGLDQHRLDGVRIMAAAFTNIARDHLDYHGTEEAYFKAKARLFTELLPSGGTAVLNADDAKFGELSALCRSRGHRILGFGHAGKEFRLVSFTPLA
ncbi:MAG: hypothetical protein K2Q01_10825, partial [Rickettsiales bacterium]|nr:hypothetical protein [Rickettsiales bacterium]